jgi:hypothetical protein
VTIGLVEIIYYYQRPVTVLPCWQLSATGNHIYIYFHCELWLTANKTEKIQPSKPEKWQVLV